jgi:hypothetical protein
VKLKITTGVLYAALLAVAAYAYAAEPKGFRDVPWGASEDTLRFRVPTQSCDIIDPAVDYGTRRCRAGGGVTYGKIPPTTVFFYFRNDMLVAWRVDVHNRHRAELGKALMQQYGKPTVVYQGNHVTWKGPTSDVDFVGGPSVDTVVAVTKAELATREAERRERARRAAKP